LIAAGTLLALVVSTLGCADSPSADNQQQGDKVRALLSLYFSAGRAMGHPPRNEEEFKKYVQEQGGPFLERLNIQSVDELFTSSRDGKPYVIVYGKRPSEVVLYEAEGVDGSRMVGYDIGQVRELSAEQFAELGL
jgi:hypothetical protein